VSANRLARADTALEGVCDAVAWCKMVDLFCGIGGNTTGAEDLSWTMMLAGVDWDTRALEAYRENHPGHEAKQLNMFDVKDVVTYLDLFGDLDVIIGSPPCQEFSPSGACVEGDRADLTRRFAQICVQAAPKVIIMENTPRVLKSAAWADAKPLLEADYDVVEINIRASHIKKGDVILREVPQNRDRVFVVCARKSLQVKRNLEAFQLEAAKLKLCAATSIYDVFGPQFWDTVFVHTRNGTSRAVRSVHEPYPTLRCNGHYRPSKNYTARNGDAGPIEEAHVFSTKELLRVMGFPAEHWIPDSPARAAKLIGNAVPPPMMTWVLHTHCGKWGC
jgi:DNA (cytosine-5)-methyltransferase 1